MLTQVKKHILAGRIERLKQHLEHVGGSPKFEEALTKAEKELQSLEQQKDDQSQGS